MVASGEVIGLSTAQHLDHDPARGASIPERGHRLFYFGYGSNLCLEDFAVFCRERGFAVDCLRFVGTATLAGEELVFDRLSKRRGGGVLNIRARAGSHVEGVLFEPTTEGWRALDLKEGHPSRYRRESVRVTLADGTDVEATTYRGPAMAGFVAPTTDYIEICRRGRAAFGLDTLVVDIAARTAL
jgi:cation transport regulator ChaC